MGELSLRLLPRTRLFEKLWNTFIRVNLPGRASHHATHWKTQSLGDGHGPEQYVELQSSSHILIEEIVRHASAPNAPILDVGCNVGRHLNALYSRGFTNLYGVDVQVQAVEYMAAKFPEMKAVAHIERDTFQAYLPRVADCFFDVVYTHGATVEVVPPSFPICQHMARIARMAVIMVIHENGHAYPRLWETEFLRAGFLLTKLLRPVHAGSVYSLLVFQRLPSSVRS